MRQDIEVITQRVQNDPGFHFDAVVLDEISNIESEFLIAS